MEDIIRHIHDEILDCVKTAVPDATVSLRDDSHKHSGHYDTSVGAGTHIHLEIASASLAKMSRIAAHRQINDSLAHLMPEPLHALSIKIVKKT